MSAQPGLTHRQPVWMMRLDGPDLGIDDIFVETEVNGLSFARPEPVGDGIYQIGISGAVDNLDLVWPDCPPDGAQRQPVF